MKTFLTILLLFVANVSYADDIGFIVGSKHYYNPRHVNYNQFNPGFYYSSNKLVFGEYLNSFENNTFFIGRNYTHKLFSFKQIKVVTELQLGLVYGYAWHDGMLEDSKKYGERILPFIAPSLAISGKYQTVRFHIIGGAVALSVSYKL